MDVFLNAVMFHASNIGLDYFVAFVSVGIYLGFAYHYPMVDNLGRKYFRYSALYALALSIAWLLGHLWVRADKEHAIGWFVTDMVYILGGYLVVFVVLHFFGPLPPKHEDDSQ